MACSTLPPPIASNHFGQEFRPPRIAHAATASNIFTIPTCPVLGPIDSFTYFGLVQNLLARLSPVSIGPVPASLTKSP